MRRLLFVAVLLAVSSGGCGRLGVGLPSCDTSPDRPSSALVLAAQAVPTADYAPCIRSLQLGWDQVDYDMESGLVHLAISRDLTPFLEVTLTPSCDISDADQVPSDRVDVQRYESVQKVGSRIGVTIIPTGERPRIHALSLAEDLEGLRINDRAVDFSVDQDTDFSVRQRVNQALFTDDYVWIISDLDIEEGTLEMRRTPEGEGMRGLTVDQAVDRIERTALEISYRGNWYFVFDGGCITYDFDASGRVADSVEADAEQAFGLYSLVDLREAGRRAGFVLTDE